MPLTPQQAAVDPCLRWRLLETHRQVWVNLLYGHCSFLLTPAAHKVLFVPSKGLFPQSCGSSVIKSHLPPKSNSLGILSPFARSPGSGAWCGAKNLHKSTRTSLVLFSPLCGSLTWRVKDFVLSWLLPSYHLTVASPLSLDLGIFSQWVPVPYCLWLFNSYLKFWCSCRRRWMYILLLYNLESTSTPIFLPRKFLGQKSLVGYSQWGCKESDMTEQLIHTTIVIGQFYSEHYIRFCMCELLHCRSEVHKPAVLFLPFFSLKQSVN